MDAFLLGHGVYMCVCVCGGVFMYICMYVLNEESGIIQYSVFYIYRKIPYHYSKTGISRNATNDQWVDFEERRGRGRLKQFNIFGVSCCHLYDPILGFLEENTYKRLVYFLLTFITRIMR